MKNFVSVLFIIFFTNNFLSLAQENSEKDKKILIGEPSAAFLNLNNISTIFRNNGVSDVDIAGNSSGFKFPKSTGKKAIYQSGLLWGTLIPGDPYPHVGGSTYRTGLQGGKITNTGLPWQQLIPEDPGAPHVRVYRVRPDVYPGGPLVDLSVEALDEGKTESEIRVQYETDWNEWRAIGGAPFKDVDGDGIYNPSVDIPGVDGASQTIWFVANDLNPSRTQDLYGTDPIGIEYQATIWEYKSAGFLNNLLLRKYKLINKSNSIFTEMYISMWSDPDLGSSIDDFAGCDTLLNLGYSINSVEYDAVYYPLPPPAIGFELLKGPSVDGSSTLPMSAFYFFSRDNPTVADPTMGSMEGALQFYNFLRGRIGSTGEPFINPVTGLETPYALSGNPLNGEGWIDGMLYPSGDRRIGIASGPFQMAPGDTQEVVIAEIAGLGSNRLNSFKNIKYYSALVKDFYDTGMIYSDTPKPPSPAVTVVDTGWVINLDWGTDTLLVNQIENFNQDGYTFQGYNVYQLPFEEPILESAVKVATFDIVDGVTTIPGIIMDLETGLPVNGNQQNGSDSGIERLFNTRYDHIKDELMRVGKKYYFAVTAYTYNSDPQALTTNSESLLQIYEATFYEGLPGAEFGDTISVSHQSGNADGDIYISVADPTHLTGSDYEVHFDSLTYYRNQDGEWIPLRPGKNKSSFDGLDTLTGSTIDIGAIYGPTSGSLELRCALNLVSPDFSWADGISMTFPIGVTIVSAPGFSAGNGYIFPEINGNVINMGNVNHEYTENGPFTGGEEWTIIIQAAAPLSIDWTIYDDGYSGGPVDAEGTTEIEDVGYLFQTRNEWNLINISFQDTVLKHQTVIMEYDLYTNQYVGDPEVDGFKISVNVDYNIPKTIGTLKLNGEPLEVNDPDADYTITDFTYFGFPDGTAASSLPLYGGAGGTSDINLLQQDYELRWTGVLADTVINGISLTITQSGGSIATLFGASGYSLADHPLNPNPGVAQPFIVRIPFEIWNLETNEEVNLVWWDRSGNPTVNGGEVWNRFNRVYGWIINTEYSPELIDVTSQTVADNATWNLVFYKSIFTTGDIINITYHNPIMMGDDIFSFTTPDPVVNVKDNSVVNSYQIYQNYPNPFNPTTKIKFSLPEKSLVKLEIYNILGQRVTRLINTELEAGIYEKEFNGSALASGVYIYVLNISDKFFQAKKMILLK